jgi:hypothetical protein
MDDRSTIRLTAACLGAVFFACFALAVLAMP